MGVLTSITGGVAHLRFGAGMLVPVQGVACRCCCQSGVCFDAGMVRCKVLLEAAAARVVCAHWSGQAFRACWCSCRVLPEGGLSAAVRVVCALWNGHAVAAAGRRGRCFLRVRLSQCSVRFGAGMPAALQGAA